MDSRTIRSILVRFGSQQELAEKLTARGHPISQTGISAWIVRGRVPTRCISALLALAVAEGIKLSPADFFASQEHAA